MTDLEWLATHLGWTELEWRTAIRFLRKCRYINGCIVWMAYKSPKGYGQFQTRNGSEKAHRVSYKLFKGSIPQDKQIDHLCRNRSCVNPEHMEVVTPKVNTLRGESFSAINARKACCPKGHPYSGSNLKIYKSRRNCRECIKQYHRELRKRRKMESVSLRLKAYRQVMEDK